MNSSSQKLHGAQEKCNLELTPEPHPLATGYNPLPPHPIPTGTKALSLVLLRLYAAVLPMLNASFSQNHDSYSVGEELSLSFEFSSMRLLYHHVYLNRVLPKPVFAQDVSLSCSIGGSAARLAGAQGSRASPNTYYGDQGVTGILTQSPWIVCGIFWEPPGKPVPAWDPGTSVCSVCPPPLIFRVQ